MFDRLSDDARALLESAPITEGGAPELLQRLAQVYLGPDVVFPALPDPPAGFVTHVRIERVRGIGDWLADS